MTSTDEKKEVAERTEGLGDEKKNNVEEELRSLEALAISSPKTTREEDSIGEPTAALKNDLVKRDRLAFELEETKSFARSEEKRLLELQQADANGIQASRQAAIGNLKRRIQELDERTGSHRKNEIDIQDMQKDTTRYKNVPFECRRKIDQLEKSLSEVTAERDIARRNYTVLIRQLIATLQTTTSVLVYPYEIVDATSESAETDGVIKGQMRNLAERKASDSTEATSTRGASIEQLRDELERRKEKTQRVQGQLRRLLESATIPVAGPNTLAEFDERAIEARIGEILAEKKDQTLMIEKLRGEVKMAADSADRQNELLEATVSQLRTLDEQRSNLEARVRELEAELSGCRLSKEALRREKEAFVALLDRLAKAMQAEEISGEIGVNVEAEFLVARAEQLARLETDKPVDKTSVVYQLQRRVRTLREQLQRRDLHLDLLRRKLSLQEDNARVKSLLESERDEANVRAKKLAKQIDRLQIQISEERSRHRELGAQLTEAADYKIAALERSRKIEELQKRLIESETTRTRCNGRLAMLKEQLRASSEAAEQERSINDHSLQLLRDELARVKQSLSDVTKKECQLQSFRVSVAKLLSEPICAPDCEMISRLQKMVAAHRDFTMLSRRYDEPFEASPSSRCPSIHPAHPPRSPGPRCIRCDDRRVAEPPDIQDAEDDFDERPVRSGLLP